MTRTANEIRSAVARAPAIATDRAAQAHIAALRTDATRHATSSPGGDMVWHAWGRGPPLVLLHGGSGSWTHWIRNIAALARTHRVLAGDLPGLGDSPLPAQQDSIDALAAIVSAGIDALIPGDQPFDLAGFSFGGIVGGHVALAQARRIRRLIIVGSPPFGLATGGPANEVRAVSPELTLDQARPIHLHNLATLMFADAATIDALALRVHHDNLVRARLRSRKIARAGTLAQALRAAPCPLHGIWGECDVTVHPDLASLRELFMQCSPDNSFQVLDTVGHWAMYEDPARFNALLSARLDTA
jgi:pimeloyl-ACP methyl ester carboxylesterase